MKLKDSWTNAKEPCWNHPNETGATQIKTLFMNFPDWIDVNFGTEIIILETRIMGWFGFHL